MTRRLFITATGTDIGKTELTCRLLGYGQGVRAIKPIISGFHPDDAETDTARIAEASGLDWTPDTAHALSPWQFAPPISPDMAAAQAGTAISMRDLTKWCQAQSGDPLLIEGVGGAFVPLNDRELVADWIKALDCPFILVTGSYLGTLSHTLSCVEALALRGLTPSAIVISQSVEEPVSLSITVASLKAHLSLPLWVMRRDGTGDNLADLLALAE